MAFSLNKIDLIGYATEKPELRQTPNGINVCDLNLQVKSRFTREDGTDQLGTSFHNVVLWNKQAEIADQYLQAGSQVFINGRLKTEEWESDDGQKRRKTKVIAREIILLDARNPIAISSENLKIVGGLNSVQIIGNMTGDPELRQTPNGNFVCNFGVATNRRWKSTQTNETQEETEFHNVVVWGELAQHVAENIKKGQKVFITGRCNNRSWETPDGEKRRTTEIVADEVLLLGLVDNNIYSSNPQESSSTKKTINQEDIDIEDELPEIPEISHESKIKPEDLPF